MNLSARRISSRRESTQRFIARYPSRIPIPYGRARNRSFVSFTFRSAAASPTRTVSSHMSVSARPWSNASRAFVRLSVTIRFAFGKHRRTHRS
jgi:hypothetical protein